MEDARPRVFGNHSGIVLDIGLNINLGHVQVMSDALDDGWQNSDGHRSNMRCDAMINHDAVYRENDSISC
jgi:hypothetical protein